MMKAVQYHQYGGPEVLKLVQCPTPTPKAGEVLVRVAAASVNSWDWDKLTGKPRLYRLLYGLFKPRDPILGCDIAGTIAAIGPGTSRFKVGGAVFGDISTVFGGFAEYVCVPEKMLHELPADINFTEAAVLPHAAELAYQALFVAAKIRPGDHVLLNGGGGGTGSFAVQFAKNAGAIVTVVDVLSKKEAVLSWGADFFVDYREEDIWKSGNQYDLIVDMVAAHSRSQYVAMLKKGGQLVVVGGKIKTLLKIGVLESIFAKQRGKKLGLLIHIPNQNLDILKSWYTEGKFRVVIAKKYTLEQVPQALSDLQQAHLAGKLLIEVQ